MAIHLECGQRNTIAFVFSCPGKKEQEECRPAAGETGRNMEAALEVMSNYDYDSVEYLECDDWTRENIWITNAWPCVEYEGEGGTGRSEAEISEVLEAGNVSRLAGELEIITGVIVCCGERAQAAALCLNNQGRLSQEVRVVSMRHLGARALHGWIRSFKLPGIQCGKDRDRERVRRWAELLYQQIGGSSA